MSRRVEGLTATAAESEKSSLKGFSKINGDPQNVSQEAGRNDSDSTGASELSTHQGGNSASISADTGISDLEQILKQKTFTRCETLRLITLLHSRTIEESPTPLVRLEASTTSGSMKRRKHGDERDNFHASIVSLRVLEKEIDSPAELEKIFTCSTNRTGLLKTSVASTQHPSTIENLPDELLINIFIRLSAKQLAQMRPVSKSWNAFLSQPSFVKTHLHRSIHNNDQILLVFHYGEESYSDFKPFTAKPSLSPNLELTNFIKVPVNPKSGHTNGIKVIGSVNGLICSSYNNDSIIHIWNPSLSAVLTLPPYSTPSHEFDSISIFFRFGFDPKTDDYKVVKLTGLGGPPTYSVKWWLQVEIYSMKKGSWEVITERFPSHITNIIDDDYVCADGHDGHIHWLCRIGEKMDSKTIVAFDLGSETFGEILFPNSILQNRVNVLGVSSEKLCVMSYIENGAYEVWVMEEYGVAESWVKSHVFSQFIGDLNTCVFGFTSRNEFLIEDNGYLVLYDPIANEQKILENHCPEDYGAAKIVEYVDSLVWIEPAEHA